MKRYIILPLLFFCSVLQAQNSKNFYYVIKKRDVDNGKLRIIYRNEKDSICSIRMCHSSLKAEDLHIEAGVPVFHFEKIKSSQYDDLDSCISNNTKLGKFEIDVKKRKIGNPNIIAKIPFRAINWGISVTPYRVRFAQDSIPFSTDSKIELAFLYGYTVGYAQINHEAITHYYFTSSLFLGATTAKLTKASVTEPQRLKKEQNSFAASYGVNMMFGRNNFGVSLCLGFDTAFGQNSTLWIYQNKPWIGLGVSTNLAMLK
jgi:hypothetical protein